MHFTLKVISIIIVVIIIALAAGVLLYKNYEKNTTGDVDFYVASGEVANVTGIYLTINQISTYNGFIWTNHSVYKVTDLYEDNFSSPGLIAEINLPAHNYTLFRLYMSTAYVGISGSYYNLSLTSNYTENAFYLNLAGGENVNLLFGFKIAGNLNISERTLNPVTTLTKQS